jgi:hypothetical protein
VCWHGKVWALELHEVTERRINGPRLVPCEPRVSDPAQLVDIEQHFLGRVVPLILCIAKISIKKSVDVVRR